jgi:hypothetical protein
MARTKQGRKGKVTKVMREFKQGKLKSGGSGRKVKSRKQAVAIAMSESGQSRNKGKRSSGTTRRGRKPGGRTKKS